MKEHLTIAFGGTIKTSTESWFIQYEFEGPDKRYSIDSFIIQGAMINEFIETLKQNYENYVELKEKFKGNSCIEIAPMNMKLCVGGFYEGVALVENYFYINSKRKLTKFIKSLEQAKEIAKNLD